MQRHFSRNIPTSPAGSRNLQAPSPCRRPSNSLYMSVQTKLGNFLNLSDHARSRAVKQQQKHVDCAEARTLQKAARRISITKSVHNALDDDSISSSYDECPPRVRASPSRQPPFHNKPSSGSDHTRYARRGSCTKFSLQAELMEHMSPPEPPSINNNEGSPIFRKEKTLQSDKVYEHDHGTDDNSQRSVSRSHSKFLRTPMTPVITVDQMPVPFKRDSVRHQRHGSGYLEPASPTTGCDRQPSVLGKAISSNPPSPDSVKDWQDDYQTVMRRGCTDEGDEKPEGRRPFQSPGVPRRGSGRGSSPSSEHRAPITTTEDSRATISNTVHRVPISIMARFEKKERDVNRVAHKTYHSHPPIPSSPGAKRISLQTLRLPQQGLYIFGGSNREDESAASTMMSEDDGSEVGSFASESIDASTPRRRYPRRSSITRYSKNRDAADTQESASPAPQKSQTETRHPTSKKTCRQVMHCQPHFLPTAPFADVDSAKKESLKCPRRVSLTRSTAPPSPITHSNGNGSKKLIATSSWNSPLARPPQRQTPMTPSGGPSRRRQSIRGVL